MNMISKKFFIASAAVCLLLTIGIVFPHIISRSSGQYLGTYGWTTYDSEVSEDFDEQISSIGSLDSSISSILDQWWFLARGPVLRSKVTKIEDAQMNTGFQVITREKYYWSLQNYTIFNIPMGSSRYYKIPDA